MIITIDGPTASGKSTVARQLARLLGYHYINSGMLYRVIAYVLMHNHGYRADQLSQEVSFEDAQSSISHCRYEWDPVTGEHIFYKDRELTAECKQGAIDFPASLIGLNIMIRNLIGQWIGQLAQTHNIVIDGRDTGTALFPHAEIKIYLTASSEVRALRWQRDQRNRGKEYSYEQALALLHERDERDMKRSIAPLTVPSDAITIDSSSLDQQQVLEAIVLLNQKNKLIKK